MQPAQPLAEKHTYGQILKSSALIGGSTVLNIAIGIVRTKAMAVLLGPTGVGLMGLYASIADLTRNVAGMGINSSGVRQMAEAFSSGDTERIVRTATVLRRISILLGVLGATSLLVLSIPISRLTFGSHEHAGAVALLALAVLLQLIAGGNVALIQGMRRISDMAKMDLLGAFLGAILSICLVYFFGQKGLVPALVGGAAMGLVASWWYCRKVQVRAIAMTGLEVKHEAAGLLKLGFAFMASGFLTMGAAYAVRIIVVHDMGLDAAGLYSAAWTLGGLYVGFVLQAMGVDFYPRLVGVAKNDSECNRLVNEQAQVSLLLAGPGVIATLTLAPLVIDLLYTPKFAEAVHVLRWICLGIAMRVITWPMGFIIVAKNRQALFVGADLAWTAVNVGLTWLCVKLYGLNGAGIAFFGSYVFHALMIYPIARWLSGFRWSPENRKTGLSFIFTIAVVFCGFKVFPPLIAAGVGALATLVSSAHSIRALLHFVSPSLIPARVLRFLVWLRLRPSGP